MAENFTLSLVDILLANATESTLTTSAIVLTWRNDQEATFHNETLGSIISSKDYSLNHSISDDVSSLSDSPTSADRYGIGSVYMLIAVLGVILNTGTIGIIIYGRHISSEVKIQLINLAAADIISAIFVPAYVLIYHLQISFPQNLALCKAVRVIGWGAFYTSPLWNVAIGLERLFIVYFPLKAAQYTRTHKLVLAVVVWCCGYLPEIESILYSELEELPGYTLCHVNPPLAVTNRDIYEIVITVKYLLPAVTIIAVYIAIGIKLVYRKQIGETTPSMKQAQRKAQKATTHVSLYLLHVCIG